MCDISNIFESVGRGRAIVLVFGVYRRQIGVRGLREIQGIWGIGGEGLVVGWSVV